MTKLKIFAILLASWVILGFLFSIELPTPVKLAVKACILIVALYTVIVFPIVLLMTKTRRKA